MIGREINGKYRILEHLGQGGFGSVYLVESLQNQSRAALKFLANYSQDALVRFAREARLLGQNTHNPYVVKLFEYDTSHLPPLYRDGIL
jgi:eukaryotic-like serine/threonine-protein kinase